MKYTVHPINRTGTGGQITYIALYKTEIFPLLLRHQLFYGIEIVPMARAQVIDAYDFLAEIQQFFKKVGPNESGNTRNKPTSGSGLYFLFVVTCIHCRNLLPDSDG